jgi:hypothetical protein
MPTVNVGKRVIFHKRQKYGPGEADIPQATVDRLLKNGAISSKDVKADDAKAEKSK